MEQIGQLRLVDVTAEGGRNYPVLVCKEHIGLIEFGDVTAEGEQNLQALACMGHIARPVLVLAEEEEKSTAEELHNGLEKARLARPIGLRTMQGGVLEGAGTPDAAEALVQNRFREMKGRAVPSDCLGLMPLLEIDLATALFSRMTVCG